MNNILSMASVLSLFTLITACSSSNVVEKYYQEGNANAYIEIKSDNTFDAESPSYPSGKSRTTGKYSINENEVVLTLNGSGRVLKATVNGSSLVVVDHDWLSTFVYKKQ
jgi:hypothetical protein